MNIEIGLLCYFIEILLAEPTNVITSTASNMQCAAIATKDVIRNQCRHIAKNFLLVVACRLVAVTYL